MSSDSNNLTLHADGLEAALSQCKSLYIQPRDDVPNIVICPAMEASDDISIMMGFFSSGSFAEIAPGLASFLKYSDKPLRLIISPFVSEEDQKALRAGVLDGDTLAESSLSDITPDATELASHTLQCLAWLIAHKRLTIRIAIMRTTLFHPKAWLFRNGMTMVALHGSANMTYQGLRGNREQLALARSWTSADGDETCRELLSEFELLWSGGDEDCLTVDLPTALADRIVHEYKRTAPPTEHDFRRLWSRSHNLKEPIVDIGALLAGTQAEVFSIPDWLEFRSGAYAHQGKAIDAWEAQECRGILEMCTGSGKTLTALAASQLLHEQVGPLLIVVTAPYNVLLEQWCSEMRPFGLKPINMSKLGGRVARSRELLAASRRLRLGSSSSEAIIVSNDTICTPEFQEVLQSCHGQKLLIADECHNLGAANFINNPPNFFDFRLGLSATPVRQYDDEGTHRLFKYFGDPCFSYTLEEAIGNCLTPYDYHVTFVQLSPEEMSNWSEISSKIGKLAWKIDAGEADEYLNALLLKRRRILETASAKLHALEALIKDISAGELRFTLIYATDKDPEQLRQVNAMLHKCGVFFHQLTSAETSNSKKSSRIIDRFQSGDLQVLTAKRVLDEGVNIPQILQAYILASTTVKRQWIQRRGRLLRTCGVISKEHAVIHDLVSLPPGAFSKSDLDNDEKKIINAELDRVWEFARLSQNGAETGGPFEAVESMRELVEG